MRASLCTLLFLVGCAADPAPVEEAPPPPDPRPARKARDEGAIARLKSDEVEVRRRAALELGDVGPEAERGAVPALTTALKDGDAFVRRNAAAALGSIGSPRASRAIGPLIDVLRDRNPMVGQAAAEALGRMGRRAQTPLGKVLSTDTSPLVRALAAVALGRLGGEGVDALIRGLKDPSPDVRESCAESLGRLGRVAYPAVAGLLRTAKEDADPRVRRAARQAAATIRRKQPRPKTRPAQGG